jgi:hypothetical protein
VAALTEVKPMGKVDRKLGSENREIRKNKKKGGCDMALGEVST